jgi:hypothetical protein
MGSRDRLTPGTFGSPAFTGQFEQRSHNKNVARRKAPHRFLSSLVKEPTRRLGARAPARILTSLRDFGQGNNRPLFLVRATFARSALSLG